MADPAPVPFPFGTLTPAITPGCPMFAAFVTVALSVLSQVVSVVLTVARWAVGEVLTHALFAALLFAGLGAVIYLFPDSAFVVGIAACVLGAALVLWFGLHGPAALSQTRFGMAAGNFAAGLSPPVAPAFLSVPAHDYDPDAVPVGSPDGVPTGPCLKPAAGGVLRCDFPNCDCPRADAATGPLK